MVETQQMDPGDLLPLHEVQDESHLATLTTSMREHGWKGAPIVFARTGYGDRALTGSHRLAAAQVAGIEVPVVDIEDLMAENGQDWLAMSTEYCNGRNHDPVYAAACDLRDYLPEEIMTYYGMDAGG